MCIFFPATSAVRLFNILTASSSQGSRRYYKQEKFFQGLRASSELPRRAWFTFLGEALCMSNPLTGHHAQSYQVCRLVSVHLYFLVHACGKVGSLAATIVNTALQFFFLKFSSFTRDKDCEFLINTTQESADHKHLGNILF